MPTIINIMLLCAAVVLVVRQNRLTQEVDRLRNNTIESFRIVTRRK